MSDSLGTTPAEAEIGVAGQSERSSASPQPKTSELGTHIGKVFSLSDKRVVFTLAAAALLIWLPTRLLVVSRFPFYMDDGILASYAQQAAFDPAARFIVLVGDRGLMGEWVNAFLVYIGFTPIAALWVYHLVSGLVTAILAALIAYRIWGTRVALAVAWITVVLPYLLVYNVTGTLDTLVNAFAIGALYFQMKVAEKPRFDLAMVLGFFMGAAILTKQSGVFPVVLLPFSLILFPWGRASVKQFLTWVGCAATALVITGAFYSLQFLSPLFYKERVENHHFLGDAIAHAFTYFRQNWPGFQAGLIGYLTPPLIALLALGIWQGFRSRPRHTALLLVWVLVPVGTAGIIATVAAPRYLLITAPLLAIFIGLGLARALEFAFGKPALRAKAALAMSIALLFGPALYFDGRVLADPNKAPYPGMDEWQYVTSQQLSGVPLSQTVDEIKRRSRKDHVPIIATYNSFNPGVLFVALNGRAYGPSTKYVVTGTGLDIPRKVKFVLVEDRIFGPYYMYGWPIDQILGRERVRRRGNIDPRYRAILPKLSKFRLIRRIDRPRGGASVLLFEIPSRS